MQVRGVTYWDAIVWAASLAIFGGLFLLNIHTDIQAHVEIMQMVSRGEVQVPATFLYPLVVYMLAFFRTETVPLLIASAIILSLSVVSKFIISRLIFEQSAQVFEEGKFPGRIITTLSLLLLIAFSLPTKTVYLGQIPPNVWHNSTTIAVMPFALALFWFSFQQLVEPKDKRIITITILCIINILIKPSFFFVFCLIYPLMLLFHFRLNKKTWQNLVPIVTGSIVLVGLYILIYIFSFGNVHTEKAGIAFYPLRVWSNYSSNIPLSLLASLVFPLAYLGCYFQDFVKNSLLRYATMFYIGAVGIFALLAETGPREFDGNFFWQCVICSYILFLVLLICFAEKIQRFGILNWRNILVAIAFSSHVIAGIVYLEGVFLRKALY